MRVWWVLVAAFGCGRLQFDPIGPGGGDGGLGDGDLIVDGDPSRANVAFITRSTYAATLGGVDGADATCAAEASAAGLPGKFVALLSTPAVNARDRVAGSRGWVRADGAPVADMLETALQQWQLFNPVDHDASGVRVDYANPNVWTATLFAGTYDPADANCAGWTDTSGNALTGRFDRTSADLLQSANVACSGQVHVYCFEIGHALAVAPGVTSGARIAFVSAFSTITSEGAADAQCQSEATTAGLPGNYLAALATQTSTIASRFTGTQPWRRVDGVTLGNLLDGTDPISFVNQTADGTYIQSLQNVRTGATSPTVVGTNAQTCNDWTATGGQAAQMGDPTSLGANEFWAAQTVQCGNNARLLCLQQ
jgi:hypothetical protein